jgi:type I restriction enzyme, S subunit
MSKLNRARIGDICTIEKGTTGLASAMKGKYPLVATGAERKSSTDFQFDAKAVCIPLVSSTGHGKKTLNYVHYQEGKFALGSILAAVIPKDEDVLDARYLHTYLQKNKDRVLVPLMKGAANVSLSVSAISNIEIPLPSLQKQRQLLAKIDSISNEHEEFVTELDVQENLFNQLRQALLREAIEGKLTAEWRKQNPKLISGEHHASKLLERIRAEKDKLIKEGKVRKEKPLPPITDAEKPFDLPEGWVWCRLGEAINVKSSKRIFASDYVKEGVPFYRSMEIGLLGKNKEVTSPLYISRQKFDEIKRHFGVPKAGDILLACIGGSIGNTWVVDEREFYYKDGNLVQLDSIAYILTAFLLAYLSGPLFYESAMERVAGTSYDALTIIKINHSFLPLPPFNEQQAIAESVYKMTAIIDQLEKQVSDRKEQSVKLIQSVLREAFEHSQA